MYHEEKVLGDVLYYRTTPNGEWIRITYKQLLERLMEAENKLKAAEQAVAADLSTGG